MKKIKIEKRSTVIKRFLLLSSVISLVAFSMVQINVNWPKFIERLPNIPIILRRFLAIDFVAIPTILKSLLISLSMSFLGLVIGVFLSFILAFLAARNITPNQLLSGLIKTFIAIIRAIPSLVWGIILVASIGFGNEAGLIVVILSAIGFLTKAFITTIEDVGDNVIEAMAATGSCWIGIVVHGLLPIVITGFISSLIMQYERGVALSISLGIIGITGIGLELRQAMLKYNYERLTTIVLIVFAVMFLLELVTNKTKAVFK